MSDDDVEVTYLPVGYAKGCRDLERWSKRRLVGRSGVPEKKPKKRRRKRRLKKIAFLNKAAALAVKAEAVRPTPADSEPWGRYADGAIVRPDAPPWDN